MEDDSPVTQRINWQIQSLPYQIYYPSYTDRTSRHQPLVGWNLLEFGHSVKLIVAEHLNKKISQMPIDLST